MASTSFKILGLGNPLLDISASVPPSVLEKYNLVLGHAILAGPEHLPLFEELIGGYSCDYTGGGATQNTIRAAQWFSQTPGLTVFFGSVGAQDSYATKLIEVLQAAGVQTYYQTTTEAQTGICASLIVGKERTLVANVAAAEKFTPDFLEANWSVVESAELYYHEGFFLVSSLESCLKLAQHASTHDKIYAINISAVFIPEYFKDALAQALEYADYVFCNETEAKKFADVNGFETTDPIEIAKRIASLPKKGSRQRTMVITQGSRATIVSTPDAAHVFDVPRVDKSLIVDTNGAGDSFVGGFLAELVKGSPIERCVSAGHYVAREVIQQSGCVFPDHPNFSS